MPGESKALLSQLSFLSTNKTIIDNKNVIKGHIQYSQKEKMLRKKFIFHLKSNIS